MSLNPSQVGTPSSPVVVSAGRRVDASDASTPRFPAENVARVRARVEEFLQQQPAAVVCSAACGSDLILLQAAQKAGVPCHVLLPSPPEEFRRSSVVDRGGEWGAIFDAVLADSSVEVHEVPKGQEGYLEVNLRLLDKAQDLANELGKAAAALVIWNLESRGKDDVTEHFLTEARRRNVPVSEISTL